MDMKAFNDSLIKIYSSSSKANSIQFAIKASTLYTQYLNSIKDMKDIIQYKESEPIKYRIGMRTFRRSMWDIKSQLYELKDFSKNLALGDKMSSDFKLTEEIINHIMQATELSLKESKK